MGLRPWLTGSLALALILTGLPARGAQTICIDPGHGGSDPGAVGCGLEEAAVTLDVSWMLHDLLEADPDLNPIMTRTADVYVSLAARCDYANDNGAARFASIHCNAFNSKASGIETYCYYNGSGASFDQRDRIQKKMTATWPALPDRGGKTAGYYVIKYTAMPATLSELAFIDNCAVDAPYLSSATQLKAAAQAHHNAIRESLGLAPLSDTEPPDEDQSPVTGVVRGTIYQDLGSGPDDMSAKLPGTVVEVADDGGTISSVVSNAPEGLWMFALPAGTYSVTATRPGFWPNTRVCKVKPGEDTWCSIGLVKKPDEEPDDTPGILSGVVFEDQGVGTDDMSVRLPGASINIVGNNGVLTSGSTGNPDGDWSFDVPAGAYLVSASHAGYWMNKRVCQVAPGNQTWCSMGLSPKPQDRPTRGTGMLLGVIFEDQGVGSLDMSVRLPGSAVGVLGDEGVAQLGSAAAPDGNWSFELPPGTYLVTASDQGYWMNERVCEVVVGQGNWCSIGLFSKDTYSRPDSRPYRIDPNDPDARRPDASSDDDREADATGFQGDGEVGNQLQFDGGSQTGGGQGGSGCSAAAAPVAPVSLMLLGAALLLLLRRRRRIPLVMLAAIGLLISCADEELPSGMGQTGFSLEAEPGPHLLDAMPLTSARDYLQPLWSPTGEHLAFAGQGFRRLFVLPRSGGQPLLVARGPSAGYGPHWHPDGLALGYRRPGQKLCEIPALAVSVTGGRAPHPRNPTPGSWAQVVDDQVLLRRETRRRRISPPGDRFCCAQLSNDGRYLAFQGLTTGIWIHDVLRDETHHLGAGNHPRFSARGRLLVYDQCDDDGQQLVGCLLRLADLAHPQPISRVISGAPALARYPSFSPDGAQLAFEVEGAIWTATLRR